MAKPDLTPLTRIDGFVAAALVDSESGLALATEGNDDNLELAAAGNTEVIRAKLKVNARLKMNDNAEDILISMGKQYHLLRPLREANTFFLLMVLNSGLANLTMARHQLQAFEQELQFS